MIVSWNSGTEYKCQTQAAAPPYFSVPLVKIFLFSVSLPAQVTMAGDYVLAITSILIARLRNSDVTITLNQVRMNYAHVICKFDAA